MRRLVLLVLVVASCLPVRLDASGTIWQDDEENLHLNTSSPQRVFVNGVDIVARNTALEAAVSTLSAQVSQLSQLVSLLPVNKAYFVGGVFNQVGFYGVDRFDGQTWVSMPNISTPRASAGVASFQGNVYVIGGWETNALLGSQNVERFDGSQWHVAPSMTQSREELVAASLGPYLYAIGGHHNGAILRSVERFNGISWEYVSNLNKGRQSPCSAVLKSAIYVFGGNTISGFTSSSEIYNDRTGTWVNGISIPNSRYACAATVYRSRIVLVGGLTTIGESNVPVRDVLELNDSLGLWRTLPTTTRARNHHVLVALGDYLFAIGGEGLVSNGERFNGTHWEEAPLFGLPRPTTFFSAVVLS